MIKVFNNLSSWDGGIHGILMQYPVFCFVWFIGVTLCCVAVVARELFDHKK